MVLFPSSASPPVTDPAARMEDLSYSRSSARPSPSTDCAPWPCAPRWVFPRFGIRLPRKLTSSRCRTGGAEKCTTCTPSTDLGFPILCIRSGWRSPNVDVRPRCSRPTATMRCTSLTQSIGRTWDHLSRRWQTSTPWASRAGASKWRWCIRKIGWEGPCETLVRVYEGSGASWTRCTLCPCFRRRTPPPPLGLGFPAMGVSSLWERCMEGSPE
jgi:hypothetical protein